VKTTRLATTNDLWGDHFLIKNFGHSETECPIYGTLGLNYYKLHVPYVGHQDSMHKKIDELWIN